MRVLVTGFEPFNGEETNASWDAACALPATVRGAKVLTKRLPCVFGEAGKRAVAAMRLLEPDVVVCLGEHQGGSLVSIERVALNVASSVGRPDESGYAPYERPLVPGGPFAYPSTLDVVNCSEEVERLGIPCALSCSAGLYVCNSVMYATLHEQARAREEGRPAPAAVGFVHVPAAPRQAARRAPRQIWPSMDPELSARAVAAILEATLQDLF